MQSTGSFSLRAPTQTCLLRVADNSEYGDLRGSLLSSCKRFLRGLDACVTLFDGLDSSKERRAELCASITFTEALSRRWFCARGRPKGLAQTSVCQVFLALGLTKQRQIATSKAGLL
jgi:hypothetical protein